MIQDETDADSSDALSGEGTEPDPGRSEDDKDDSNDDVLRDLMVQLTEGARQVGLQAAGLRVPGNMDEFVEACVTYHGFLSQSLTKYPSLATLTFPDDEQYPLLCIAVSYLEDNVWHPLIKLIIKEYPSALLWPERKDVDKENIVDYIASHSCHHELMPWIAKEYSWVLDRYTDGKESPDMGMVWGFIDGTVPESELRRFLEVCPRILFYQPHREGKWTNECMALHYILNGDIYTYDSTNQECSADFFKWMVDQNPSALGLRCPWFKTILHCALVGLADHQTENMAEICRYTIEARPDLVQEKISFEELCPVCQWHFCQVQKDIITIILEEYSEPFDLVVGEQEELHRLRNNFLRDLKLLLDERKYLEEFLSYLPEATNNLIEATVCTKNTLHTSLSSVFHSWSALLTQQLERKLDIIPLAIDQVWTKRENLYGPEKRVWVSLNYWCRSYRQ